MFETTKINEKEAGVDPFFKVYNLSAKFELKVLTTSFL